MKVWGYWATLGWAVLAFIAGQFIALGVMLWMRIGDFNAMLNAPFDGAMVTVFILISNPITIAVIALAVWIARAPLADYLALKWAATRDVILGLVCIVVLVAISDGLLYFSGYPLVTDFQLQSYTSAAAEGWLAALWLGTVVFAPAGEEILFRGFLFRGWARSERMAWPAIVVISVLWSLLHVQYDWTGILQIFIIGLVLGWMRWRSGSTLLTFLLHGLFNLEGTMETLLTIRFFS
jgi:uncharacterized protein